MKKSIKLIVFMTLILFTIMAPTVKTYAETADIGGVANSANDFINTGKNPASNIIVVKADEMKGVSDLIYNVLFAVAIIVLVLWGTILGIQFITGAAEEKAEIKKALVPYVVGTIIVFSTFSIWKLVVTILQPLA